MSEAVERMVLTIMGTGACAVTALTASYLVILCGETLVGESLPIEPKAFFLGVAAAVGGFVGCAVIVEAGND